VLLTIVGAIGRSAVVPQHCPRFALQRSVAVLSPIIVDPKFLMHQLESPRLSRYLVENARGTAQKGVYLKTLGQTEIWLPPFAEQLRIVAKIEELFSELEKGVESLLHARAQLGLYRAVVLNEATQDGSGSSFPTKSLSELIGPINQGWSPKCELNREPLDAEWAIIKTTAIQPMRYDGMECKPLPQGLAPRPNIEIHDGDLLMTRKGPRPRTGVVCHVRKARPRSMLCDTVYRFRCNEDLILPEYLELALNSPRLIQEINSRKSGISESGISLNHGKLETISVPVPLKDHQKAIVSRAQERLSKIDNVEAVIADQISHAEVLRQAILQRAFRGALVAQDPSDEPASVLLERINAEKEYGGGRQKKNKNAGKKEAA
jgi:type I restriction enzyme S subunit